MSYPLRVPRIPSALFTNALTTAGTFDSGIVLTGGAGFEHAAFQLVPGAAGVTPSGFSAQVFGTLDPNALLDSAGIVGTTGGIGSNPNPNYPAPGAAGGAWFPLPAPSEQAGTGTGVVNPLTAINQVLESKVPCLAYWVQVTVTAPVSSANVVGWTID